MDISRRMSTRDQMASSAFRRSRKEVWPPRQDVLCQKFWLSVQGHFSVTLLKHALRLAQPVSDYVCYSMGVINSLFHSSLFWGLVFTFFICFRIICLQYGGGSFLALVLRTKFFFMWIPRELDLDLGDFPGPGVRQLWRKQGFYWKPVWVSLEWLSGTYFLPPTQFVDCSPGQWRLLLVQGALCD